MNQKLHSEVMETHQLLDEYIGIHDELIAPPKGIIGILKKIFKPIDFKSYAIRLISLTTELKSILIELNEPDENQLQKLESQLKQSLIQFIKELVTTVEKLTEISKKLSTKAEGKAYSMNDYNQDMKEYDQHVNLYTMAGSQLNQIFHQQQ